LFANKFNPGLPSTCNVVFIVSIGVKNTLKLLAHNDANIVFTPMFKLRVVSKFSRRASANALDAVSPNLLTGPWISAGVSPLYSLGIPPSLQSFLNATVEEVPYLYW